MIKQGIRKLGGVVFGRKPRAHTIPYGPLRGYKIFMSFEMSPRMWFGIGEPWIAELAGRYVAPNSVVYDIGAHVGYTTLLFAKALQGTGCVHAFEILPSIAENHLKRTVELNQLDNVTIHNVGLGRKPDVMTLPLLGSGMTSIYLEQNSHVLVERCVIGRLDDYVKGNDLSLRRCDLIKIDIEGAELDCLHGAELVFDWARPKLIIEFYGDALLRGGVKFLRDVGYTFCTRGGAFSQQCPVVKTFPQSVLCIPEEET